ncbi:hypothetical protein ACFLXI_10125 [Chloroflexota bacterium]
MNSRYLICYATEMIETGERPPTGDSLLDQESRVKLPELYTGEEQGLAAPNLVHNRFVGIGRKLVASLHIKSQDGLPQADPTCLARLLNGEPPWFWRLTA